MYDKVLQNAITELIKQFSILLLYIIHTVISYTLQMHQLIINLENYFIC